MTYSAGWAHGCRSLCRRGESGDGTRCPRGSRACKSCVRSGPRPPEVGAPKKRRKERERRSEGKEERSFFPEGDSQQDTVSLLGLLDIRPAAVAAASPGTRIFITPMSSLLDACLSSTGRSFIHFSSPRCHSCSAPTHCSGALSPRNSPRQDAPSAAFYAPEKEAKKSSTGAKTENVQNHLPTAPFIKKNGGGRGAGRRRGSTDPQETFYWFTAESHRRIYGLWSTSSSDTCTCSLERRLSSCLMHSELCTEPQER